MSGQTCQICGDDVGLTADGELFVACNECAFPVCRTCYEYERREGNQVCPQCKTRFKRLKGKCFLQLILICVVSRSDLLSLFFSFSLLNQGVLGLLVMMKRTALTTWRTSSILSAEANRTRSTWRRLCFRVIWPMGMTWTYLSQFIQCLMFLCSLMARWYIACLETAIFWVLLN